MNRDRVRIERARHSERGASATELALSIEAETAGMQTLLEPFQPLPGLRVGFYLSPDGAVVEFMEYADPDEAGWF